MTERVVAVVQRIRAAGSSRAPASCRSAGQDRRPNGTAPLSQQRARLESVPIITNGAVVSTSVLLFPHTRNAQKENGRDQTVGACGGPFAWVSAGNCRSLEAGNIFVRGAKARALKSRSKIRKSEMLGWVPITWVPHTGVGDSDRDSALFESVQIYPQVRRAPFVRLDATSPPEPEGSPRRSWGSGRGILPRHGWNERKNNDCWFVW